MKYRLVKLSSWWTGLYDTGYPQFLYYDFDLDRFEVANYKVAREYKWEFSEEELALMQKEFNLSEFLVEKVRKGMEKERQTAQYAEERAYVEKVLKRHGYKYRIDDNGESSSPRYSVVIEDPTVEQAGFFTFMNKKELAILGTIQSKYKMFDGFSGDTFVVKKFKKGENGL